jgi:hypothetical protein
MSKDPSALPNTGARSSIQVQSFDVPVGCVAFWVSVDSAGNLWMQVGYYICDGSTPVVFTQVWNLASYTVVYANILSSTPTPGIHQFAVYLQSGTTWAATYDGTVVGSYDLGASVSSSSYPVYAMSEENGLAAAISIPTTSFSLGIQAQVNGVWVDPASISVYNYGGTWGLQGPGQNPLMAADSFVVGGSLPSPSNCSPL